MKNLKHILIPSAAMAIVYLLFAFTAADINAMNWKTEARAFLSFLFGGVIFIYALIDNQTP